jgi:MFS family permease
MSTWFIGNGIANIIAGVLAYGIGRAQTSLAPWRLLFIILGSITCAWGGLLAFLLPDSPSKARFFNAEERNLAIRRTLANRTGIMDEDIFKISQVRQALLDPQAWLLTLYTLAVNIPNGGVTNVSCPAFNFSLF